MSSIEIEIKDRDRDREWSPLVVTITLTNEEDALELLARAAVAPARLRLPGYMNRTWTRTDFTMVFYGALDRALKLRGLLKPARSRPRSRPQT